MTALLLAFAAVPLLILIWSLCRISALSDNRAYKTLDKQLD